MQMLVFYTWSVRLLADTVSLFSATEDIGWLAEETPQEGAALISASAPDTPGGKGGAGALNPASREDSAKRLSSFSKGKGKGGGSTPSKWPSRGAHTCLRYCPCLCAKSQCSR